MIGSMARDNDPTVLQLLPLRNRVDREHRPHRLITYLPATKIPNYDDVEVPWHD